MTAQHITTETESLSNDGQDNVTEAPATKPTRMEAIESVVAAANCTQNEASDMLDWLSAILDRARTAKRSYGQSVMHPRDYEMETRSYDIFDTVIPHDATPAPGSAHDIVGRHLLNADRDELFLTHYQTVEGDRTFCNVEIGYQL